jgi:erythromycin esterase-like protein/predicted phosphoribosyltransferase
MRLFQDRRDAGRRLAEKLGAYARRPDVLVLALPRGGVPVACEVARALDAPLDVFVVRKLGVPGHEELAMGAVATGGVRVLNEELVSFLGIPAGIVEDVADEEVRELERREQAYRGGRPAPEVEGRTVILVDDGLATGSTMRAAVEALRRRKPWRVVVAVPVAPREALEELERRADEVVCVETPEPFVSVGRWYEEFSQTGDDEVRELLAPAEEDEALVAAVRAAARPLTGAPGDYDSLLERLGEARFALLGEATHGSHEFYAERAAITKRLILEKGCEAVAVEADWPDAHRVHRYVRGESRDVDAREALSDFRRFPAWMWRNQVVVEFVEWLRRHNDGRPAGARKVGFYGLDLYGFRASMRAVLQYLDQVDPEAGKRARERYACFDHFVEDTQVYGLLTGTGAKPSCREEVVQQLVDLRARDYARRDGQAAEDEFFTAEMNARLVKNAEEYYRTMLFREESSWNLRDRHMAETLGALERHLARRSPAPKIAVWAHNSHLGDARATEMSARGELNLGQILRETRARKVVNVAFTTHHGTVTAASAWGGPAERRRVRPALAGSVERAFHAAGLGRFLLAPPAELRRPLLERAIGVIYRPDTERWSHYFQARLAEQFDVLIHIDETRAVEPLERAAAWDGGETAEFPFAAA